MPVRATFANVKPIGVPPANVVALLVPVNVATEDEVVSVNVGMFEVAATTGTPFEPLVQFDNEPNCCPHIPIPV